MDTRLVGTVAMSATGTALVVAFSDTPVPNWLGGALKGLALLAMLLTIFFAMRAPAQSRRRAPGVGTVLSIIAALVAAIGGSSLAGAIGLSFHFVVAWCVLCIGALAVTLGGMWRDESSRRGGWLVVALAVVGCVLGLTPYRELGSTLAGLGGGLAMVAVAGMSAWRARW